nr:hypothetical protein [Tanacetum cinerariifolium]
MGLWYLKDSGFELIAYLDADLARCNDDCKSTSRGIQFLGDKLVSWSLKKQDCTAMSTEEAEYVSLSACCAQVIWMWTQLLDYGFQYTKISIYYDSQSAIAKSCNLKGTIELYFVGMEYQLADLFIKAPKERLEYLVHMIVETPENQFVTPVNIEIIEAFMNRVGYQGVVDKVSAFYTKNLAQPWQAMFKKKEAIQYPRFIKLIIVDLMKKFPEIPQRIEEDYHSIKDNILLEIRVTDDFKEYETVFINIDVLINQRNRLFLPNERIATVSPTTATTSKDSSTTKHKKRVISYKTKTLPGSIAGMYQRRGQIYSHIKNKFINHEFFMSKIQEVLDHCNKVIPEITFAKTIEMIREEMPRLVNLVVNKDREVDPINAQEMIAKEFATHGPKMIEELF